jgi:flagellar biosynthetic protein FlhB
MAEGDDKTEGASPRRLEKAREQGQAAVSRELSMLVSLSAGILAAAAQADAGGVAHWLAASLQVSRYEGAVTFQRAGTAMMAAVAPVAAASLGGYAAATLLQTGFLFHPGAVQPNFSKISPLAGIKRLFGSHTAVQMIKSLIKLGLFGACLWIAIGRVLPDLPVAPLRDATTLLHSLLVTGVHLALLLLGVQAAIAGADLLWERASFAKQQRMTRQEQRDEHKESEGNPQAKQRLRQLARARVKRRMLKAVPKAALVLTNPTHYAVALAYERGAKGAPRVVAKGADDVAERIRDVAREHRVPIIANPPLARALFRVEIDTEIPAEHFKAVAEIIAYVWRMRARAGRR